MLRFKQQPIDSLRRLRLSGPSEALAHNSYGVALAATGRVEEAIAQYKRAIELNPRFPDAHNNFGSTLVAIRRYDEAAVHFRKALEIDPKHAGAHSNLGALLAQLGRIDEAIPHLQEAIARAPGAADAYKNLGLALALKGRFEEATPYLEQVVNVSGDRDPAVLDLLGRGYAALGRFPEAVQIERQALAGAIQQISPRLVEALKAKITLYESGRKN